MINYKTKNMRKTLLTGDFYDRYNNYNKTINFCRQCSNYNCNFSCSPVEINIEEYIRQYKYADIINTKVEFSGQVYRKNYTKEEFDEIINQSYMQEKKKIKKQLLEEEKTYPEAVSITGPCNYCKTSCKKEYDKCIHPEYMRYSLSSLGFDSEKILEEVFNIKLILLDSKKLPPYMNSLTAILYNK